MFINIWIVIAFTVGGINHFCIWIFIFMVALYLLMQACNVCHPT